MKEKKAKRKNSIFSIYNYVIFFLTISFLVTCCFLLFLTSMELDPGLVRKSAGITFVNVLFLSLLCTLVDGIRRKFTVKRPVKRILEATEKLTQGDFSVRIKPFHPFERMNEFDVIIENFNKMAQELSGIEMLRTDFIANVSHELKTPLAVIQNYSTMLQNPAIPNEKQIEYAKSITDATRRLTDLITNILKLNKLENQQIFPDIKRYDLGEQLCECLLAFENTWEKKELNIETDIQEDIMIAADRELLCLVWNNLFSNAMKFTHAGGSVCVHLKQKDDYAVVMVADNGCGMTAEVGQHIFDKFYQGDKSHAVQGNGLGLALVRRVVDIVGAELSVDSTLGKGSTFIIKLRREGA